MSYWKQYKSPLGYTNNNNNQIDSYGVNHSGFNTQDELQYQNARINRENNLITQMIFFISILPKLQFNRMQQIGLTSLI